MKTLNRVLKAVVSSAAAFAMLPFSAYAEEISEIGDENLGIEISGEIENITWNISPEGVLTISGTGDMPEIMPSEEAAEFETADISESEEIISEEESQMPETWLDYSDVVTSIVVEDGITSISDYAFVFMTNVTDVSVAGSVNSVGEGAFFLDLSLKKIRFNEGLEEIGCGAFSNTSLTSVKFPSTMKWIHSDAFSYNDDLTEYIFLDSGVYLSDRAIGITMDEFGESIVYDAEITGYSGSNAEKYASENGFQFTSLGNTSKENFVPEAYKLRYEGKCGEDITWTLKDGVLTLSGSGDMPDFSMDDTNYPEWFGETADNITSVVIEEGITSIGEYAFYRCSGIESISIPSSAVDIGQYAFYGTSPEEAVIPDGVVSIGAFAFDSDSLRKITLPDSIESISDTAFLSAYGDEGNAVTICGSYYTYAEIFAESSGFIFEPADSNNKPSTKEILSSSFDYENFGFTNDYSGFPMSAEMDCYYINDKNLAALVANLSPTEYFGYDVINMASSFWGGSCYGMSVLLSLIHNGEIQLSSFAQDVSVVSELVNDEALESIINYYQLMQFTNYRQSNSFIDGYIKDDAELVNELIETITKAESEGKYVPVGFFTEEFGHELSAAGVESGNWTFGSHAYDYCIAVVDPNFSYFNISSCIYCNSQTGEWIIPLYCSMDSVRELSPDDPVSINDIGLIDPTGKQNITGTYYDYLNIMSNDTGCSVLYEQNGKSGDLKTDNDAVIAEDTLSLFEEDSIYSIELLKKESADSVYSIIPDNGKMLNAGVFFRNSISCASTYCNTDRVDLSGSCVSIEFGVSEESIDEESFMMTDEDYVMEYVTDDSNSTIDYISVSGLHNESGVSLEASDDGFIFKTDNILSAQINASNMCISDAEELMTQNDYIFNFETSDVSPETEAVFIRYSSESGMLEVYEDKDANGSYETALTDYGTEDENAVRYTDDEGNIYIVYFDFEGSVTNMVLISSAEIPKETTSGGDVTKKSDTKEELPPMIVVEKDGIYSIYADNDGDGKYEEFVGNADRLEKTNSNKTASVKGDLNGDGKSDSKDATILLKDYAGTLLGKKSEIDLSAADMNGDGKADSKDATIILTEYAKSILK